MSIGSEWNTTRVPRARAWPTARRGAAACFAAAAAPRALCAVRDLRMTSVPGIWDIPEPDPAALRARSRSPDVDFALVPALAVDRARATGLGYGAGYFDRLLAGRGARPFCVTALAGRLRGRRAAARSPRHPVDLVLDECGERLHGKGNRMTRSSTARPSRRAFATNSPGAWRACAIAGVTPGPRGRDRRRRSREPGLRAQQGARLRARSACTRKCTRLPANTTAGAAHRVRAAPERRSATSTASSCSCRCRSTRLPYGDRGDRRRDKDVDGFHYSQRGLARRG